MSRKTYFSDEDVELAKTALADLPDLTSKRKSLQDFLGAIQDDIIVLVRTKGYTVADIKSTLKEAGYDVGEKAIRDIIRNAEATKKGRKKPASKADNHQKNAETVI